MSRFQQILTRFSPERPCWELSCLVAWNAVLHLWICHFIRGRVTSFVDTSRVFCFSHSTWVRDTKSQHMACRDWECFLSSRRAILYSRPGKSRVKWWVRYLLENFTKMVIIFDPTDGFWWELSQTEKNYPAFEWDTWCCWENFVEKVMPGSSIAHMTIFWHFFWKSDQISTDFNQIFTRAALLGA